MPILNEAALQRLDLEKLMDLINDFAHEKQDAIHLGDQNKLANALRCLEQLCDERDRRRGLVKVVGEDGTDIWTYNESLYHHCAADEQESDDSR